MTVLEVIQRSAEFLQARGVDSPRLQVELMLAQLLGMPRLKLYLNFERVLADPELGVLREWVKRRAQREPLQHILGTTSFCGLEISVSNAALIPRPETEILAQMAWTFLQSRGPSRFLDFGTGTGCLALAILKECPSSRAVAQDVSVEALDLARKNAAALGLSERVEFVHDKIFPDRPASFDLVVSNPPYIPSAEISTLQPEVQKFDPHVALDGGSDGLNFYRLLAGRAGAVLMPGGKLMAEFGDGQEAAIQKIFEMEKWIVDDIRKDYSGRPRFLTAQPCSPQASASS